MVDNLPATLSTNLPTSFEGVSDSELMAATGQGEEYGLGLPSLRVNYDDEDDDGNKIPRGQWVLYCDGGPIFAPNVDFRVIYATYQYSHYDAEEGKTISKSAHFMDFREEVYDTAGGMKCGKLPRKTFETLSKAEQDMQRKIKLSRVLFGLVDIAGVDKKGKKAKVAQIPCVFYARGTNYMPLSNLLQDMLKKRVVMQRTLINLALKREKNEGVTYWEAVPTITEEHIDLTQDDFELLKNFAASAEAENEEVYGKWKKAVIKENVAQKDVASSLDPDDGLGDFGPDQNILAAG